MDFLSGRVLQSVCALIPSCSDPSSDGQVSVLKCHPWIGNADMHSTQGIIIEFQSHTYYIESSQRVLLHK